MGFKVSFQQNNPGSLSMTQTCPFFPSAPLLLAVFTRRLFHIHYSLLTLKGTQSLALQAKLCSTPTASSHLPRFQWMHSRDAWHNGRSLEMRTKYWNDPTLWRDWRSTCTNAWWGLLYSSMLVHTMYMYCICKCTNIYVWTVEFKNNDMMGFFYAGIKPKSFLIYIPQNKLNNSFYCWKKLTLNFYE